MKITYEWKILNNDGTLTNPPLIDRPELTFDLNDGIFISEKMAEEKLNEFFQIEGNMYYKFVLVKIYN